MQNDQAFETATNRLPTASLNNRESTSERVATPRRFEFSTQAERTLAEQMIETIWNALPFQNRNVDGLDDMYLLLDRYGASLARLMSFHQEAEAFLQTVCLTNFEVRSDKSVPNEQTQVFADAERSRLLDAFHLPPFPLDPILTAEVTNESVEQLRARMQKALREATEWLVNEFLCTCVRLVKEELFGVIEWANASSCVLTFFRNVVVLGPTKTENLKGKDVIDNPGADHEIYSRTDTISVTGKFEMRKARFEHHLFKANRVSIEKNVTSIPLPFQELVRAIPDWLRPNIDVITGIQFREQISEMQGRVETWTNVQEQYVLVSEPAIALGPIVFSGWGTAEIEAESRRQDEETQAALLEATKEFAAGQRNQRLTFLAVHQVVSVVLIVAGLTSEAVCLWLGTAWTIVGAWLAYAALRYDAQARNQEPLPRSLLLAAVTFVAGSFCLHLIIIGLVLHLWLLLAAGFLVLGLAVSLLRHAMAARNV